MNHRFVATLAECALGRLDVGILKRIKSLFGCFKLLRGSDNIGVRQKLRQRCSHLLVTFFAKHFELPRQLITRLRHDERLADRVVHGLANGGVSNFLVLALKEVVQRIE